MKIVFKTSGQILAGTFMMLIFWMIGLGIGNAIIPANFAEADVSSGVIISAMLTACFINTTILTIMIKRSAWYGWNMIWAVALVIYGVQFFLSMIEGLVFNDALNMPRQGFYSILVGGLIFTIMISPLLVWINGKIKKPEVIEHTREHVSNILIKVCLLAILVYPALYLLAGYYIAWQSESLREFYTGSTEMEPFLVIMKENFRSGLVYFQFIRGFLWLAITWPLYQMLKGGKYEKGIIIGLLLALIMNSQHIIPNPYMPREISTYHFIETAVSNFIWGFLIAVVLAYKPGKEVKEKDLINS
jgi:MFS family permease